MNQPPTARAPTCATHQKDSRGWFSTTSTTTSLAFLRNTVSGTPLKQHMPHEPKTKHHRTLQSTKPAYRTLIVAINIRKAFDTDPHHQLILKIFNTDMHPNFKKSLQISSPTYEHTQITTASLSQQNTTQTESRKAPYSHLHLLTSTCTTCQFLQSQTRTSCHTRMTLLSCHDIPMTRQQQLTYKHTSNI